jgi:hypothetical protein
MMTHALSTSKLRADSFSTDDPRNLQGARRIGVTAAVEHSSTFEGKSGDIYAFCASRAREMHLLQGLIN